MIPRWNTLRGNWAQPAFAALNSTYLVVTNSGLPAGATLRFPACIPNPASSPPPPRSRADPPLLSSRQAAPLFPITERYWAVWEFSSVFTAQCSSPWQLTAPDPPGPGVHGLRLRVSPARLRPGAHRCLFQGKGSTQDAAAMRGPRSPARALPAGSGGGGRWAGRGAFLWRTSWRPLRRRKSGARECRASVPPADGAAAGLRVGLSPSRAPWRRRGLGSPWARWGRRPRVGVGRRDGGGRGTARGVGAVAVIRGRTRAPGNAPPRRLASLASGSPANVGWSSSLRSACWAGPLDGALAAAPVVLPTD